jgi:iron complex transport system substrate-binding protein
MSPKTIGQINESIIMLSNKFMVPEKGKELVKKINVGIDTIQSITKNNMERPRVFCMDWMDPIYSAGHWVPEMVTIAGGDNMPFKRKERSVKVSFDEILKYSPHYIFIMPCGFEIDDTLNEINLLLENPQLNKIPAFNKGQVYIVNANAYYSKPTYRILEGIKIIARTINRENFKYEPEPDAILNLQNYMHFESFSG